MKASHSRIQLAGVALLLAVMVMSVALPAAAQAPRPMRHVPVDAAGRGEPVAAVDLSHSVVQADGRVQVIVTLAGAPAVTDYLAAGGRGSHAAALGTASIREAQLRAEHDVFAAGASSLGATVVNSSAFLVNTVTVAVAPDQVAALLRLPGVVSVHANRVINRDDTTSIPLIRAPEVWEVAGFDGAGGVIGIADTGVDYIHTHFGGSGNYADNPDTTNGTDSLLFPAPIPGGYGDPKVIGGYDYVGDLYDAATPGLDTPAPDEDPMDCAEALGGGHGSHVAGTAAGYGVVQATGATYTGPMDTTYYGSFPNPTAALRIGPGVAPGASLVALRIFGCNGSVGTDVLLDAIEDAVTGTYPTSIAAAQVPVDVLNMSLGSSYGGALPDDPLIVAQEAATAAGMIIVDSAGNSGNIPLITGSPSSANSVISVSSSLDTSAVGDVVVHHNSGLGSPGAYPGAAAAFNNGSAIPFTGDLVVAQPLNGCATLTNPTEVAGNVVLIQRGSCAFVDKANNGLDAGATGVIIYNNAGDALVTMSADGIDPSFNLPAYFLGQTNGTALKNSYDDAIANSTPLPSVTFDFGTPAVYAPEVSDQLSSFSSRGGVVRSIGDLTLKPNVTAPGNTITSARSGTGNGLYVISGTSMASPHVTGFAALLRHKYTSAPVSQIKALIMNTANHNVFTGALNLPPQHVGSGRVDAVDAIDAEIIAYATDNPDNVALSFGYPHVLTGTTYTVTKTVTIQNLSANSYDLDVSYQVRSDHPNVTVTVNPSSVTLAGNGSATVDVTFEAMLDNAATNVNTYEPMIGDTSPMPEEAGILLLEDQGMLHPDLRVPVYGMPQITAAMDATTDLGNAFQGINVVFSGTGVDTSGSGGVGADIVSLATLTELVAVDPVGDAGGSYVPRPGDDFPQTNGAVDITHVGITSDFHGGAGGNTVVYFAIAAADEWASPSDVFFNIYIDEDFDGVEDFIVYNSTSDSSFSSGFIDIEDVYGYGAGAGVSFGQFINEYAGSDISTMHRKNNVMVIPIYLFGVTGIAGPGGTFNYWIEASTRDSDVAVVSDTVGSAATPFTFDIATQNYYFNDLNGQAGGPYIGIPTWYDLNGYGAPVDVLPGADPNALPDILVLHHHNTDKATRVDVLPAPAVPQSFALMTPANNAYIRDASTITAVTWSDELADTALTYRFVLSHLSTNTRLGTVVDVSGLTPAVDTDGLACDGTVCTLTVSTTISSALEDGQYSWTVTAEDIVNGTIEASNSPFFFTLETNDIELIVNGGFEDCVAKVAAPWTGEGCKLNNAKSYAGDGYFNGKPAKKVKQVVTHPAVATLGAEDLDLSGYFDAKASAGNVVKLKVVYVDPNGGAGGNGKDKLKLKFTTDSVGYELLSGTLTLTGPVTKVKVIVGSGVGKVKADDVSLVVAGPNGPAPRDAGSLLPPPAAPGGFRGKN